MRQIRYTTVPHNNEFHLCTFKWLLYRMRPRRDKCCSNEELYWRACIHHFLSYTPIFRCSFKTNMVWFAMTRFKHMICSMDFVLDWIFVFRLVCRSQPEMQPRTNRTNLKWLIKPITSQVTSFSLITQFPDSNQENAFDVIKFLWFIIHLDYRLILTSSIMKPNHCLSVARSNAN